MKQILQKIIILLFNLSFISCLHGQLTKDYRGLNGNSGIRRLVTTEAGQVIAGGYSADCRGENNFHILSLQPDGRLEPSFADRGELIESLSDAGFDSNLLALTIDCEQRILAGGRAFFNESVIDVGSSLDGLAAADFVLIRLTPDGKRDRSFASEGKFNLDASNITAHDEINGLAVACDASGGIYVGGEKEVDLHVVSIPTETALIRLHANGSVDSGFSSEELEKRTPNLRVHQLEVTNNQKLLGLSTWPLRYSSTLWQMLPNGSLDNSFGEQGIYKPSSFVKAFCRTTEARILVGSEVGNRGIRIVRLHANGTEDTGYGQNGEYRFCEDCASPVRLSAMVIDHEERLLLLGRTSHRAFVVRVLESGYTDESFADGGVFSWELTGSQLREGIRYQSIVVQHDESILLAGYENVNGREQMAFIQLNPEGQIMPCYGSSLLTVLVFYQQVTVNENAWILTGNVRLDRPLPVASILTSGSGLSIYQNDSHFMFTDLELGQDYLLEIFTCNTLQFQQTIFHPGSGDTPGCPECLAAIAVPVLILIAGAVITAIVVYWLKFRRGHPDEPPPVEMEVKAQ